MPNWSRSRLSQRTPTTRRPLSRRQNPARRIRLQPRPRPRQILHTTNAFGGIGSAQVRLDHPTSLKTRTRVPEHTVHSQTTPAPTPIDHLLLRQTPHPRRLHRVNHRCDRPRGLTDAHNSTHRRHPRKRRPRVRLRPAKQPRQLTRRRSHRLHRPQRQAKAMHQRPQTPCRRPQPTTRSSMSTPTSTRRAEQTVATLS